MHSLRRAFAAVAFALVVAPLVSPAPLFDPDEGLHAAIAQEMVQRGDYVTPTFLGEPFLDKPILFFWAEAASLRLCGGGERAVRLPPLLFGLLGMASVAALGASLFGRAAGLTAGIVYGTMLLPLGVSQVAVHDIGLVPFLCLAAYCVVRASIDDPGPGIARVAGLGVLAGAALGLSILTKGLVGVVFVCVFAACLGVARPHAIRRIAGVLAIAAVVSAAVAAPWYLAMEHAHPGYLHYYFVERHLRGYLTATQRHAGRGWWYYVPIAIGGALPWTAYLAVAARELRARPARLLVWCWFAAGLMFLSAGESKLVTYALPLFPALAILVGDGLAAQLSAPAAPGRGFRIAAVLHTIVLAALPAAGLAAVQWKFGASHPLLWPVVAAVAVVVIAAMMRARRSTTLDGFMSGASAAAIVSLVGMMAVLPHAAAWMTAKDLAGALNGMGTLPPRVSVFDERIGSLVFYLSPPLRADASPERLTDTSMAEAIGRARVDPDSSIIAVRNTQLPRFFRLFPRPPAADARAGTFTIFRALTLRETLQSR